MKKKAIEMVVGTKSSWSSPFAIFESFQDWEMIKTNKVLPDGVYFAVITLEDKSKADIHPNIFVQGYRPHSSGAQLHVDKRRYGKFISQGMPKEAPDDVEFDLVQLYQVKEGLKVELVLKQGECQTAAGVQKLVDRICEERQLEKLSEVKHYRYTCPKSVGYYLKNRTYNVWSIMVGVNTGLSLDKKVLIIDYLTGIPAIVLYEDSCFEKVQ